MTPELMGRLPKRLFIEQLDVTQLKRILHEPKNALLPEKRFYAAGTTDLRFTQSAIRAIAEEALSAGTQWPYALREIVEQVLDAIVFSKKPAEVTVTAEMVKKPSPCGSSTRLRINLCHCRTSSSRIAWRLHDRSHHKQGF